MDVIDFWGDILKESVSCYESLIENPFNGRLLTCPDRRYGSSGYALLAMP